MFYTPGFFRDGKDWQGWRSGQIGKADTASTGRLTVRVVNKATEVYFESLATGPQKLTAHVVLLGMNLETSVGAGENKGRKLHHDFVALDVTTLALSRSGKTYSATAVLPDTETESQHLALAVWISESGRQAPIQAVGGYLSSASL